MSEPPRYIMYCTELNGELVLNDITSRAWEARRRPALMFKPGAPLQDGWKEAKRAGWKVVRVIVQKDGPLIDTQRGEAGR